MLFVLVLLLSNFSTTELTGDCYWGKIASLTDTVSDCMAISIKGTKPNEDGKYKIYLSIIEMTKQYRF